MSTTAALLMNHSIVKHGMGTNSPDTCLCGEQLMPNVRAVDGFPEDISVGRRRAFALHVANAADEIDDTSERQAVINAFSALPYCGSLAMGWGHCTATDLTFSEVAARLASISTTLRAVADSHDKDHKRLRELEGQRAAVRDFLGLTAPEEFTNPTADFA